MYPDSGFVETDHRADFARRAIAVVAEHEHGALAAFETFDGGGHARAPLAGQQTRFRIGLRGRRVGGRRERAAIAEVAAGGRGVVGLDDPAIAPDARLAAIEAAVDENAREPDLEGP